MEKRWAGRVAAVLAVSVMLSACGGGGGSPTENAGTVVLLPSAGGTSDGPRQPDKPAEQTPPPPDPVEACQDLTACLDLQNGYVAAYKGGKQAAASYTFDDGYESSFAIADLFESRGLRASFYIVASLVPDEEWTSWKQLGLRGHEVGNHSMTHTIDLGLPETTEAQLATEILDSQRLIAQKLGSPPLVFAFPWHSSLARSRELALSAHFAIRTSLPDNPFTLAFFDEAHGTPQETLATVNQQLRETIASGGWFVAGGHGIDGDGWSPVSRQFLVDHLDYAQQSSSALWIDTFANVARYRACRKQATLKLETLSSRRVKLSMDGTFSAVCTQPLTAKIPLQVAKTQGIVARDGRGAPLPLATADGSVTVDIRPGESVTLETAE